MNRPDHVVVVLLADLQPAAIAWGWWRVARGQRSLQGQPGLVFAKALGSGHDGGFGLRPSATRQGLLAVFQGEDLADEFIERSPHVQAYCRRSRETCILKLRATSSRGSWGGHSIAVTAQAAAQQPVVALTRASIRPRRAGAFWRQSPPSETSLARAQGCRLAVGLGEAPVLRQATLSLWQSQEHMDAYARSGAHLAAIHAAYDGRYFSESMFVRFVPEGAQGSWRGRSLA
jgi:spheroidene monooxygenase